MNLTPIIMAVGLPLFLFLLFRLLGGVVPASHPRPARWSLRGMETLLVAVMVLCAGWTLLAPYSWGPAAAVGGTLVCGMVAICGRGGTAGFLAAMCWTLAAYYPGFAPNAESELPRERAPLSDPQMIWDLSAVDVEGADLWINGVHLGKTPLQISVVELLDRIPDWTDVPDNRLTEEALSKKESQPQSDLPNHDRDRRWLRGRLPGKSFRLPPDLLQRIENRNSQEVFVRARLYGEDGVGAGSYGMSRSNDETIRAHLDIRFPRRDLQLNQLLQQARLSDYRVESTWFEQIETMNDDGWQAIRLCQPAEPGMSQLLDDWATRITGPPQAGQAGLQQLMNLAERVDTVGEYNTASVVGHAVERIAILVPADQLVSLVTERIANTRQYSLGWSMLGDTRMWVMAPGANRQDYEPPSTLLLGHAVWSWIQHQPTNDPQAQEIRDQLAIALLQHHDGNQQAMNAVHAVNSPLVNEYFIATARRAGNRVVVGPDDRTYRTYWSHEQSIDQRWYRAAQVDSPAGRMFRRVNFSLMRQLADLVISCEALQTRQLDYLDFVFLDPAPGSSGHGPRSSLAEEMWPIFRTRVDQGISIEKVKQKLQYLSKAERVTPTEQFVMTWLTSKDSSEAEQALDGLQELPVRRRAEVLDAMLAAVEVEWPFEGPGWSGAAYERSNVIRDLLQHRFVRIDDEAAAARIVQECRLSDTSTSDEIRVFLSADRFSDWLTTHAAERPVLVQALCHAEESGLRRLVIPGLEAYPTPAYLSLLQELAEDGDAEVRKPAEQAVQRLQQLRTMEIVGR